MANKFSLLIRINNLIVFSFFFGARRCQWRRFSCVNKKTALTDPPTPFHMIIYLTIGYFVCVCAEKLSRTWAGQGRAGLARPPPNLLSPTMINSVAGFFFSSSSYKFIHTKYVSTQCGGSALSNPIRADAHLPPSPLFIFIADV